MNDFSETCSITILGFLNLESYYLYKYMKLETRKSFKIEYLFIVIILAEVFVEDIPILFINFYSMINNRAMSNEFQIVTFLIKILSVSWGFYCYSYKDSNNIINRFFESNNKVK